MTEQIVFDIPGTLESPPMKMAGKVVDELPETANRGDLVQLGRQVFVWTGKKWQLIHGEAKHGHHIA